MWVGTGGTLPAEIWGTTTRTTTVIPAHMALFTAHMALASVYASGSGIPPASDSDSGSGPGSGTATITIRSSTIRSTTDSMIRMGLASTKAMALATIEITTVSTLVGWSAITQTLA